MSSFNGLLSESSPLRAIFTDGRIPLNRATLVQYSFSENELSVHCYMLDLSGVTPEQKAALAQIMSDAGQGSKDECAAMLGHLSEYPIRETHFLGVNPNETIRPL